MSQSRGNIPEPWQIIDKYGTDALRWFFYTVNAPGDSKRMGEKDIAMTLRKFNMILWNVYLFFITYANIDGWKYEGGHWEPKEILDKWIVSYFFKLVKNVEEKLDSYDITGAAREIEKFNTDLSTWYLRRTRKRRDNDFYATMYKILIHFSKVIAPFTPFIAEEIYQNLNLKNEKYPISVHLCDWPEAGDIDEDILKNMEKVRTFAEKGLSLRAEKNIRTRQPLSSFTIDVKLDDEYLEILKQELNVLKINIGKEISLDTKITLELKKEGDYRDLLRSIQALRKKAGLKPGENTPLLYETKSQIFNEIITKKKEEIQKLTNVILEESKRSSVLAESDYNIDSEEIWLGIK